jgi:hypothetical protein
MKGQDSLKSQRASACTLTPAVCGGAERKSCRIASSSASDSGEMTDLVALLTFPSVSNYFSVLHLHLAIRDSLTMRPSLPPSKVARLDTDSKSDSASASRSRAGVHPTSRAVVTGGPIQVYPVAFVSVLIFLNCSRWQNTEYDHRPSLRATETLARAEHQIGGLLALLPRYMSIIIIRDTIDVRSRMNASTHYAEMRRCGQSP